MVKKGSPALLQNIRTHPDPVIGDADDDVIAGRQVGGTLSVRTIADGDADRPGFVKGFARIRDKVEQHRLQSCRLGQDRPGVRPKIEHDAGGRTGEVADEIGIALDEFAWRKDLRLTFFGPRKIEQTPNEPTAVVDRFVDLVEHPDNRRSPALAGASVCSALWMTARTLLMSCMTAPTKPPSSRSFSE